MRNAVPNRGSVMAMDNTRSQIAENIRTALNDEGYTTKNLTEILPVSYSQATRLISGKSAYRPQYIAKLARVLGIDPERLVGVNPNATTVLLTVKEAAEATKYHADTIRKAVSAGDMKASQRCKGGKYLIRESDLTCWLAGAR